MTLLLHHRLCTQDRGTHGRVEINLFFDLVCAQRAGGGEGGNLGVGTGSRPSYSRTRAGAPVSAPKGEGEANRGVQTKVGRTQ